MNADTIISIVLKIPDQKSILYKVAITTFIEGVSLGRRSIS